MAYKMAATVVTLNDLEGCRLFQMQSVEHLCSFLQSSDIELTISIDSTLGYSRR